MTLAAVLYVSNQELAKYPIEYVAGTLDFADKIILYAGTDADYAWLAAMRRRHPLGGKMELESANFTIDTVAGISGMMTQAYAAFRDRADYILLVQADECATPESIVLLQEFMADPANIRAARHQRCRISFLYHDFLTGWGHTVIGHDWGGKFIADGFGEDPDGSRIDFLGWWSSSDPDIEVRIRSRLNGCLEIGSLSPELYYWHQRQNVRVWNEYGYMGPYLAFYPGACDEDPKLPKLPTGQTANRETFIVNALRLGRQILKRPLVPIETNDPRFTKVIDDLGLRDDCTYVCNLVKTHGFDQPWG